MTMFMFLVALLAGQQVPAPGVYRATFQAPGGVSMRYAVSVPRGYDGRAPVPLVLALHPGGDRFPYIGGAFMEQVILPALYYDLDAIVIAPDAPGQSWTDDTSEQAVLALVRRIMRDQAIDARRVLVAGFSMGGRGTWTMSARHPDLFTGAIVMAGSTGDTPVADLGRIPTYVIHSREDDVVPFRPAERTARELEGLGRTVHFDPIDGAGHFDMGSYVEPLQRGVRWILDRWSR